MRGRCQAAAELNGEGGGGEAGEDEQGDPGGASPGGQLPGHPDSGGDPPRAVCDQPQEVAQPSCGRGRGWRWHGLAFLLLTLESKVDIVQVTFTLDFSIILPRSQISWAKCTALKLGEFRIITTIKSIET